MVIPTAAGSALGAAAITTAPISDTTPWIKSTTRSSRPVEIAVIRTTAYPSWIRRIARAHHDRGGYGRTARVTGSFEEHRAYLHAVAYRRVGSASDADDAVQEAWLRWDRTDNSAIRNPRGWLTTVLAHVCLDMLRVRSARREDLVGDDMPERADSAIDPGEEAVLADSVGIALLVILQ